MNKKGQFLDLLKSSIEDEGIRQKLVDASNSVFMEYEVSRDDAIESRDKAKVKLKANNDLIEGIQKELSLDDDFNVSDVKGKLKIAGDSTEIEAKYKGDIEALRTALSDSEAGTVALQNKFNDTMFTNAITQSGVMDNYIADTMARNNIVAMYKDNTLFEDGKLYAKDTATGKIATDLTTGAKLGLESVTTHINSSLNPIYLATETKASGTGTPPPNQSSGSGKKFSDYTSSELVALNRSNPTKYAALRDAAI